MWQNGAHCVGFNEHSRAGVVLFNTEWRFMLCFARAGAWKKTLLGVFLLFAGGMALGNVPQLPDWTKEKVPARVENALGGGFLAVDPVLTNANNGRSFNRYVYANNNPFKYIDPDGRQVIVITAKRPTTLAGNPFDSPVGLSPTSKVETPRSNNMAIVSCLALPVFCTISSDFGSPKKSSGENDHISDGSPSPDDDKETDQPNENDLDKIPEKDGNKAAQEAGYKDAHDAKSGRGDSKVNIYNDKSTGQKWLWNGKRGSTKEIL